MNPVKQRRWCWHLFPRRRPAGRFDYLVCRRCGAAQILVLDPLLVCQWASPWCATPEAAEQEVARWLDSPASVGVMGRRPRAKGAGGIDERKP